MANCKWCGRTIVGSSSSLGTHSTNMYCSRKCEIDVKAGKVANDAAQKAAVTEQVANFGRVLKIIGIAFMALVTVLTAVFYLFPKFLKGKSKKLLYTYIIIWIILIAGVAVYFLFFSPEAISGIKIKIVSASCDTSEKFTSIVNKALTGVAVTYVEGEEFITYSQQAYNTVKEREGKYSTVKDCVYFVRFPDKVNGYIWFNTEDEAFAYIYK